MRRKLLLWLAIASVSTVTWAVEPSRYSAPYAGSELTPEALNVHRWDATIHSAVLDNIQTIRFSADETEMVIWTVDQQVLTHSLPEILKVTFGEYLANDETTRVEDCAVRDAEYDVRKVMENGQLVIIQNGVRYNVLGVRL